MRLVPWLGLCNRPHPAQGLYFFSVVLVLLNQNSWAWVRLGRLVPFQASLPVTRAHHLCGAIIDLSQDYKIAAV